MFKYCFITLLMFFLSACQTVPDNSAAAKINVQLGLGYLREHQVDRAKEKLLRALNQAPNLSETQLAMGYFLLQTNQANRAANYYQRALELASSSGRVQNNYGVFLCRTGQFQQAIHYFLKATKNRKYLHVASAYENAGLCALKIPDRLAAKHYFELALKYDPNRIVSRQNLRKLQSN